MYPQVIPEEDIMFKCYIANTSNATLKVFTYPILNVHDSILYMKLHVYPVYEGLTGYQPVWLWDWIFSMFLIIIINWFKNTLNMDATKKLVTGGGCM